MEQTTAWDQVFLEYRIGLQSRGISMNYRTTCKFKRVMEYHRLCSKRISVTSMIYPEILEFIKRYFHNKTAIHLHNCDKRWAFQTRKSSQKNFVVFFFDIKLAVRYY